MNGFHEAVDGLAHDLADNLNYICTMKLDVNSFKKLVHKYFDDFNNEFEACWNELDEERDRNLC